MNRNAPRPTTLVFVRHAQSQPSAAIEDPRWPLSDVGLRQAERIVPVLARLGISRLYSSPYLRCIKTVEPFAKAHGLKISEDAGLRERKIAPGWMLDFTSVWKNSWSDFSFALEGCEDSYTCQRRIVAAVKQLVSDHPGETIAVSSHGNAIALYLNACDPAFGVERASQLRNPELTRVHVASDGTVAIDENFDPGRDFDEIATSFHNTPGIKA